MNDPATLDSVVLARAAAVIKCLGHPLRLRILEALEDGERTVVELQARTGATQAMVSQQLATLRGRGIVTPRRAGQYVRYSIADATVHRILDCVRHCARQGSRRP